jgi:hypothetical protein
MFHLFQMYVAIVYLDVVKVDLDVAYTCMFQVFSVILYLFLQVFHLVTYVCIGFQIFSRHFL